MTIRQVADTSRRAYAIGKQALAMINAEKKHFDASASDQPGTTPLLTCLNGIAQGDTDVTRDGSSVRFKALQFQMLLHLNTTTQPLYDVFRVVIFRHYQPAGVNPTNALVMATTAINSFTNWHSRDLYEILLDKTYCLDPTAGPFSIADSVDFRLDDVTRWNGATAASTDLDNNGYWIMCWGIENTNKSVFGWQTRMLYYDN